MDLRIDKLADVLVNYSTSVKKGDHVVIMGSVVAKPLIAAVYAKVLQAGGHPFVMAALGMNEIFFRYASEEQLSHLDPPLKMILESYDVGISIDGPTNTKALSGVDPAKIQLVNQSQAELFKTMMERIADRSYRWLGTQYPTNAGAQDAEMGLLEYEDFVYGACLPDMDNPVGYWQRFSAWQAKIVEWFKPKDRVRVVGPGTDLELSVSGRVFMNCDGRLNMPDGEICASPVENSANGHVTFSYPAVYQGREVTGVQLWFEEGKVVKATAEKNQDFLLSALDTDEGARFLGEFAIGTNKGITRFTRSTLFDEKIDGSFHLALGAGLPETGGVNESAIHWDMVCDLRDGGEIWVDDDLLYKDGDFVIKF